MLRVEMHDSINALIIKVDGPFALETAEHLRALIALCRVPMRVLIDVTEIASIETTAEAVLFGLAKVGYRFIADAPHAMEICRRLHLPLARRASRTLARARGYQP